MLPLVPSKLSNTSTGTRATMDSDVTHAMTAIACTNRGTLVPRKSAACSKVRRLCRGCAVAKLREVVATLQCLQEERCHANADHGCNVK